MSKAPENKSKSTTETQDVAPKKNRHIITPLEEQQEKLNRLFQKIDKPVYIPEKPVEKNELQAPKDFVRNVSGSSAGAGSGDFHVYRAQRRREYARMKNMDDQERKEIEDKEYSEKLRRLREEDEERTAKKRAKRQKRNKNKKSADKDSKRIEGI
ncbi:PRKR-interacting protein 1 homolog [Mucor ambiguus]|uniref:PRKR-interacting protein 1 homolog n=1 Tax=Mucor ambiguus TaxID=91626 RepID=A0A0C9LZX7_9FUNG|nr:PRKR-interacting protein 1 homolog [Mucor ambiguus]